MSSPSTPGGRTGHAGDVSPPEAWQRLQDDPNAQIIDVRSRPEWTFVGLPDTSRTGRDPILLEWQIYPSMGIDGQFAEKLEGELERRGTPRDAPLLFLCRSGARSSAAAALMTARGWQSAFNVEDGFEGPTDPDGHRGTLSGWKAAGLPWRQQ